jgi:glycerol-3-phosphate dehydrogenase
LNGEVDWAVQQEGAARLEDFIYRRSRTALYEPGWRDPILEPAARRMATLLGWSDDRVQNEVRQVRELMASELAFARPQA